MDIFIPKIKIIGVGGAGSNIVSKLSDISKEVEIFILDTNAKALSKFDLKNKIQIGKSTLGAGSKPEVAKQIFSENLKEIKSLLTDTDLLFLVAGFGGGTGTGILPEIAKLSKELDILTISIITKPFEFEGKLRSKIAKEGLNELKFNTDSYLVIENNKLSKLAKKELTFLEAFNLVDEFVSRIIKEIVELLIIPAFINLDFADLQTILKESGESVTIIGRGLGKNKIEDTLKTAFSYSLLEDFDISLARKFILNIVVSKDVSYQDVQELVNKFQEKLDYKQNIQIIFGTRIDDNLEDEIKLTIIATDFDNKKSQYKDKKIIKANKDLDKEIDFSIYDYLDIPTYLRRKNWDGS